MSDSHDNVKKVREAVRIFNDSGCRLVIHAGDFVAPFAAQEMAGLKCPVKAVFGNCDGEKAGLEKVFRTLGRIKKAPFYFRYERNNILLMHIPHQIDKAVRLGRYNIIVYGHTHRPEIVRENNVLLVNPGETGGWVTGACTVALLNEKSLNAEIVTF